MEDKNEKKTAVSLGMLSLALAAGLLTACGSDQKPGLRKAPAKTTNYMYTTGANTLTKA